MNYGENNYWEYENQYDNYFATPNNYSHYNYSPLPLQPYGYNYIPPPPPPRYFSSYEERKLAFLQSIRFDLITLQHTLAQYSSHVYDEWSDITLLNAELVITKPPLKVEPDFNCCSICDVTGYRAQNCQDII